jgi:hypothetical protein
MMPGWEGVFQMVWKLTNFFEWMKVWNFDHYLVIGILNALSICGGTAEVCASRWQKTSCSSCCPRLTGLLQLSRISKLYLYCIQGATHFWGIIYRIGFAGWWRFLILKCIAPVGRVAGWNHSPSCNHKNHGSNFFITRCKALFGDYLSDWFCSIVDISNP